MPFQVAVIAAFDPTGLRLLRDDPGIAVTIVDPDDTAAVRSALATADAVTVRTFVLDEALIAGAPALKLVAKHGIGTDNIAVDALSARGIPVAIAPGSNDRSVAEQTIAFILALAKQTRTMDAWVRDGHWHRRLEASAQDIEDRTLLVVGYGRIGRRVARMARALDMMVLAYDPALPATARARADDPLVDDLHAALGQADYVSLHVPRTAQTVGLFDEAAFAAMRPGARLVNCARGGVVDEAALLRALESGRLAGAALDVFETEPPPADHPLLAWDDVLLCPHAAALTRESARRMAVMTAENVLAARDGRLDPARLVNPEVLGR